MLLKIDLLPSWVRERKAIRAVIIGGALVLAVVVVACVGYGGVLSKKVSNRKDTLAAKKAEADKVRQLEQDLARLVEQIGPIQGKVAFCRQVADSGRPVADRILAIRKYIWSDLRLSSWSMSGATCSMSGTLVLPDPARGLESETWARLLLNFNQCPEFVPGSVQLSVGGWSGWSFPGSTIAGPTAPGGALTSFTLSATLKMPLTMPTFGGGAGPAARPGGAAMGPVGGAPRGPAGGPAALGGGAGTPAGAAPPAGGGAPGAMSLRMGK